MHVTGNWEPVSWYMAIYELICASIGMWPTLGAGSGSYLSQMGNCAHPVDKSLGHAAFKCILYTGYHLYMPDVRTFQRMLFSRIHNWIVANIQKPCSIS